MVLTCFFFLIIVTLSFIMNTKEILKAINIEKNTCRFPDFTAGGER